MGGRLSRTDFASARLALHWAAQIPAAAGATLVPARADASHTALAWDDVRKALVSETGAALLVERFAIAFGETTIPLAGMALEAAIALLAAAMGKPQLQRPQHELPAHAVATGAPFEKPAEADLAEIARWYSGAQRALAKYGVVRCWPHHFDIAALLALEGEKQIGVGMSPGDGSYPEPYFYVTPYPFAEGDLPSVAPGEWRKTGWKGAVLRGSVLVAQTDQDAMLGAFLESAVGAGRAMLELKAKS